MKRIMWFIAAGMLALTATAATAQDAEKKVDNARMKQHTMAMMKDAAMMDMVMGEIASNDQLRMKMMEKMMTHAHADSSAMMSMCRKMMDDEGMHSMMKKMMGGNMKMEGMMHKDGMMKKEEKMDHKEHH